MNSSTVDIELLWSVDDVPGIPVIERKRKRSRAGVTLSSKGLLKMYEYLKPHLRLILAPKCLWRFSFEVSSERLTDEATLMSQSQPSGRHTASKGWKEHKQPQTTIYWHPVVP